MLIVHETVSGRWEVSNSAADHRKVIINLRIPIELREERVEAIQGPINAVDGDVDVRVVAVDVRVIGIIGVE